MKWRRSKRGQSKSLSGSGLKFTSPSHRLHSELDGASPTHKARSSIAQSSAAPTFKVVTNADWRRSAPAASIEPMTKGDVLRYAIAFALRRSRKIVRGLKQGLTEEERYAVADHAVAQLKERGDPWRLNEEAPAESLHQHEEAQIFELDGRHPPTPPPLPSLKPRSPQAGAFHCLSANT